MLSSKVISKSKILIALFLALSLSMTALVGCSSDDSSSNTVTAADNQTTQQPATDAAEASDTIHAILIVSDQENEEILIDDVVELDNGATVLDAIQAADPTVVVEDGQYGAYITTIAGKAAQGNKGWVFTVNGEEVMESADSVTLNDGDAIEFDYVTAQ